MRAILYARVSSNDRLKTGGENLANQLRMCHDYATQKGYTIVAQLSEDDRGASGATFDLPELTQATEMARTGQYDVLVVRELDRLSRDLAKQLIIEQELTKSSVSIEYVLYDFPDTPEGRLNKNLRAMLAEYEREKIKQRMMRGKNRRAEAGHVILHGRAPYGYRIGELDGNKVLEIDDIQAKVIRNVFEWHISGDGANGPMGTRTIAYKLTELGVPTWADIHNASYLRSSRPAGTWCHSVVRKMLANETYAGVWHYGKKNIPVNVPAIISREIWDESRRQSAIHSQYAQRNTKYEYLLQYRLICAECKRTIRAKAENPSRIIQYYRCVTRDDKTLSCSNRHYYRSKAIDQAVWVWLRNELSNPEKLEASLRAYQDKREEMISPIRDELETTQDLIKGIEAKQKRLLDQYLDGVFDREVIADRKQQYDTQLIKLRQRMERTQKRLEQDTFNEDKLQMVMQFARTVSIGLEEADRDFAKRRQLVELLDLTGEINFVDGVEVLEVQGILGHAHIADANPSSQTAPPW